MGKLYNSIDDFNNVSVKVNLNRKKYNAIIKIVGDDVILSVDVSNSSDFWLDFDQNYEQINGTTIYNDVSISFINCLNIEKYSNCNREKNKQLLYLDFKVLYILIGMKCRNYKNRLFDKAEVKFDNIDYLTDDLPYDYNTYNRYESTPTLYNIKALDQQIVINFNFDNNNSKNHLDLKRNVFVDFNFLKKQSFNKLFDEICKFNIFLMVVMRKHIVISSLAFCSDSKKCKIFFGFKNDVYEHKLSNYEVFNISKLKIEKIVNVDEVYTCFLKNYNKLFPVLDIYYSTICGMISNLNRFIVGTTTLEYFSNEFAHEKALYYSSLKENRKNKEDADYVDKVRSLLVNANCVFKLTGDEIEKVLERIVEARVYYIHYNKKRRNLSDSEKFYYSYFIFDILIVNIGILIKLDNALLKNITYFDKFYNKDDLLK